jgi:hypothetical protein
VSCGLGEFDAGESFETSLESFETSLESFETSLESFESNLKIKRITGQYWCNCIDTHF